MIDKQQDMSDNKHDKKVKTQHHVITTTTAEEQQWEEMLAGARWGMTRTHVYYDALLVPQGRREDGDEVTALN